MAATEQIIIEFVADSAGLAPALDKLEALGVIDQKTAASFRQTNAELQKRGQQLNSVASNTSKLVGENTKVKKSINDLDSSVKGFTKNFIQGFQEGVIDELKKAGVSAKEFDAALNSATSTATDGTTTLKTRLRELVEQLAQMKINGEQNTEQYRKLAAEASHLQDELGDVREEIRNMASDTSTLDGLIGVATGIAGAFSVAQGAAALFGDENKDLQETLVKVQGALAILNGLQAIQNTLLKQSSASKLIDKITTNAQTVAQTAYNFVVGQSTGLLKAFRIALATTGVGLAIIGIVKLIEVFDLFGSSAKKSVDELEKFNLELENTKRNVDITVNQLDYQTKKEIENAKIRGASEKEINDLVINGMRDRGKQFIELAKTQATTTNDLIVKVGKDTKNAFVGIQRPIRDVIEAAQLLSKITQFKTTNAFAGLNEGAKKSVELLEKSAQATLDFFDQGESLQRQAIIKGQEFISGQAEDARQKQKEAFDKRKEDLKKQIEEEKQLRRKGFEDFVASVDVQLVAVKKGTEEELDLQKQRLRAVLQLELDNEDLTTNQRLLLVKKYFAEREQLEADFFKDRSQKELENSISILNAELTQLNLSAAERENLTITLLNKQRDLELAAVGDNKAKQKEINAKFDREIADQSVAIFKSALDEQQRLLKAQNAPLVRADTKLADNPNADIEDRIGAIDRLLDRELESIQKRKEANAKLVGENKISQKEAAITAAELADEEAQAVENAEEKKRNAYQQTADKKKELEDAVFELTIQTAQESLDIIGQFFQQQSEAALINIEGKKKDVEQLRQAGAITEKESVARMKRLEQEEKRIRRQQAVRDRDIAIFQAVINTANAVVKAYATTGPIAGAVLAAIVGAIGAAQIALIASRPIPKFFKGKKDSYEGFGEVGERGAELIQSDGKLWVAEKPTVVWLNKKDIVYNPTETKKLLEKPLPMVSKKVMNVSNNSMNNHFSIDYKKIGEEVGKHVTNQHLEITEKGIRELSKKGNSWTEYLDKRRSF